MVSISSVSLGFLNDSFIFSIFIVFDKYTVLCTGDGSQGSNDRAVFLFATNLNMSNKRLHLYIIYLSRETSRV
jgi:hypothetical protein